MPIGVPRIIYCWGEEVPAQWTDIYNFIFRRRMVFLMQYLDDELCNQICGLLINIHMEDRSKELEKKEMEKSGLFKNKETTYNTESPSSKSNTTSGSQNPGSRVGTTDSPSGKRGSGSGSNLENKLSMQSLQNVEDLLLSEQDLAIEDNHTLEQYTLQKITTQWLTWNAQFFNYEDEPYFYYLAEILCKDFNKQNGRLIYNLEMTRLMKMFKNMASMCSKINSTIALKTTPSAFNNTLYPGTVSKFSSSTDEEDSSLPLPLYPTLTTSGCVATIGDRVGAGVGLLPPVASQPQKGKADTTHKDPVGGTIGSRTPCLEQPTGATGTSLSSPTGTKSPLRTKRLAEGKAVKKSRSLSLYPKGVRGSANKPYPSGINMEKKHFDVYSPFRLIANFSSGKYTFNQLFPAISSIPNNKQSSVACLKKNTLPSSKEAEEKEQESAIHTVSMIHPSAEKLLVEKSNDFTYQQSVKLNVGKKDFFAKAHNFNSQIKSSEKSLSEKFLKTQYRQAHSESLTPALVSNSKCLTFGGLGSKSTGRLNSSKSIGLPTAATTLPCLPAVAKVGTMPPNLRGLGRSKNDSKANYLNFNTFTNQNFGDYNSFYRKQTERTLQEEESKKVFVIINSFGGSVGNGITVHDALQFIKAGSLTLALGVAASAASLALAGGTIGERYVTEGCHVMIHQPESGLNGQASDIWIDSQEIMKIRLDVAEIYSLSTYRPRHKILRDLDRDFYLTAMETINYGLADEIATNEVMHEIIEMTSKVWGYDDTKQQRLLESRASASSGLDTEIQN